MKFIKNLKKLITDIIYIMETNKFLASITMLVVLVLANDVVLDSLSNQPDLSDDSISKITNILSSLEYIIFILFAINFVLFIYKAVVVGDLKDLLIAKIIVTIAESFILYSIFMNILAYFK